MSRVLAVLSVVAATVGQPARSQGRPIPLVLGDGRVALIAADPTGPRVMAVLTPEGGGPPASDPTPTDLTPGDRIIAFAGVDAPTAEQVQGSYQAAAAGSRIRLQVARAGRTIAVEFTRPQGGGGVLSMGASSGAAAKGPSDGWVTAEPRRGTSLAIAGFRIRADEAGRPMVGFRESHPAQGTVLLAPGDVIRAIGGTAVETLADFAGQYAAIGDGEPVSLEIVRAGATQRVTFAKPSP